MELLFANKAYRCTCLDEQTIGDLFSLGSGWLQAGDMLRGEEGLFGLSYAHCPIDLRALAGDHRAAQARLKRRYVQADLNDEDGLARPHHLVHVEGEPHALRRVLENATKPPPP